MKRKKNKLAKAGVDLTKVSIVMGVGSRAITGVGGSAAGVGTLAGFMPTAAGVVGAGYTVSLLKDVAPKNKRRRSRWKNIE